VARRSGGTPALKLLLDEMLSPVIAEQLRSRGHDVEAIAGNPACAGLPDREVVDLARSQQRAVVTNNVADFRPLHNEAIVPGGAGHFGMIFLPGDYRRTKADVGRIVIALQATLVQYPGESDLANGETWLQAAWPANGSTDYPSRPTISLA
jgi:hypothetical protein